MARRVRPDGGAPFARRRNDDAADSDDAPDRDLLRQRWRRVIGRAAPPGLSSRLMERILLWREQIARVGDIDRAARTKLAAALGEAPECIRRERVDDPRLRPGTVLVREQQGAMHRVTVTADGYVWRETTYRSLSAVARAITGVSWNGRRFFGLKEDAKAGETARGGKAPVASPPGRTGASS